jgi:hypothetical protein
LERFDEHLCNLKLRPATQRLHEEVGQCWRRARAEAKKLGNYARFHTAFTDCHIEVLRKYLEEVDRVCRQVWKLDGNAVTPEFIRKILAERIFKTIAVRKGTIQDELQRRSMRIGEDVSGAQRYSIRKLNQFQNELAARYEAEAIELGKSLRLPPQSRPTSAPDSPRPSADAVGDQRERPQSDVWRDFHERFMLFAKEEERIEQAAPEDRFLRAYSDYKKHQEISVEKGEPGQSPLSPLNPRDTGLWIISDGVNENFRERVCGIMARAGVALGCPKGTDAVDFWLHRLFQDLRENNSHQLLAPSKEGGVILRACVASATFCSRLERQAVQESESERGDETERNQVESSLAQNSVKTAKDSERKPANAAASNKREAFLRRLLNGKGFSVHDWANEARVDFHTANNYLKGKTNPFQSTRKKLADALGIRVEKLPT